MLDQIGYVKNLKQAPDVIINLKVMHHHCLTVWIMFHYQIPDVDLLRRRLGQRVDPFSNVVFIKQVYNPEIVDQHSNIDDIDDDDEDEEMIEVIIMFIYKILISS